MNDKQLIMIAKVTSALFTPFYLPLVAMITLFLFSYLSLLPLYYKLACLFITYLFTILLPTLLIRIYLRYQGWRPIHLRIKDRRIIPYIISILCYFTCYHLMSALNMPHFMGVVVITALAVQILCSMINIWWKVSMHSAAIGGMTGGLIAFSLLFNFNTIWWLCLIILLSGIVGSSRMTLRQHSLAQVLVGYGVGIVTAFTTIIIM